MKKIILSFCFFWSLAAAAQLDFGVKAGLNYNSIDDLNVSGGLLGLNEDLKSEGQVGFHAGFFAQFKFTKFYVKGELLYVQNSSSYDNMLAPASKLKLTTLEVPILVGFKIIGPLKFYIGPSLVYNIDNNFADVFDLNLERDFSIAYNVGTTLTFNKIDIDLRYSSGFSDNVASYLDDIPSDGLGYTVNTRPSQFLLSVSYLIN